MQERRVKTGTKFYESIKKGLEALKTEEGKPFIPVFEDNFSTPTIVSISSKVKAGKLEKKAEKLAFELLRKKQPRKKRERRKGWRNGFNWHAR